jgi:hypothetical protein
VRVVVAGVDRLLEQHDAGLVPEPVAKEGRRVAGRGEHRRRGQLHRVVGAAEGGRVDAQVELPGAVGPLEGDAVADGLEGVLPVDAEPERRVVQPPQAAVDGAVAAPVAERGTAQVVRVEGWQDADRRDPAAARGGRVARG